MGVLIVGDEHIKKQFVVDLETLSLRDVKSSHIYVYVSVTDTTRVRTLDRPDSTRKDSLFFFVSLHER